MPNSESSTIESRPPHIGIAALRPGWFRILLVALGIAALTALAAPADSTAARVIPDWFPEGSWSHRLIKLSRYPLDDREMGSILILIFLLSGFPARSAGLQPTAELPPRQSYLARLQWRIVLGSGLTLGAVAGLTHLLKFLVGRARPEAGKGPWSFTFFGSPYDLYDSFPSGHSSGAWTGALLISMFVPWTRWIVYPVAVLTSLSRIMQGRHWLSDTVAGAGLSVLCVMICAQVFGNSIFAPVFRRNPPA